MDFGPTVEAATPPPAISGGTLLVAADGRTFYASDPDRDTVWTVSRETGVRPIETVLRDHDEPGRLVLDSDNRLHVALRRGGAVVTIDTVTHEIIARREVCDAPRGLVFDASSNSLHVACANGELVTLPAAGGAETRRLMIEPDLRDVVIAGGRVIVSTFRRPSVRTVLPDGSVSPAVIGPAQFESTVGLRRGSFQPAVAWRMIALPRVGVAMVHQRGFNASVMVGGGSAEAPNGIREYYGSPPVPVDQCDSSIVHATVAILRPDAHSGPPPGPPIPDGVLPVDVAVSADRMRVAIVAAGSWKIPGRRQLYVYPLSTFAFSTQCANAPDPTLQPSGQAVAVIFAPDGEPIVQTREPASIQLMASGETILLGSTSREDTGHSIFHSNTGSSIACASCHPEGSDDGRVWLLEAGPRRTQNLRGGVLNTAPFHWAGDLPDMHHLMAEVFVGRMSGPEMRDDQTAALSRWIDSSPAIAHNAVRTPGTLTDAAVERGRALFEDAAVGCLGCHSGQRLTNNQTVDVGTGGFFQVPSLVGVGNRAPYMHNGCGVTLRDRFTPCGGDERHGHTAHLTSPHVDDLVAFLSTL